MTGWRWLTRCGRKVLLHTTQHLVARRPDACSHSAGVAHLPTDLGRALGRLHPHPPYPTRYYAGLVEPMLGGGHPAKMGSSAYRCLQCGAGTHRVAMRCQSSLGLRCAQGSVDNWVSQGSTMVHESVLYRPIVLP